MSYYKHFIFACLAAIGACAVSCSDDTFGTDNNNIDGRLHFRAKVIQNKQLTIGRRAAQPADACIEARNIQGPSFQGKTIWLQERTINGIFPSLKQRAATRGDIIPRVDYLSYLCNDTSMNKSLFLWGYRAKNEQDSYETWFGNQKLKIDDNGTGTFVNDGASENKYFWSADKPYCKFFALFGKDLDFIGNKKSAPTCSYNGEGKQTCSYNDKDKPTTHLKFKCPENVLDQYDLLAATKNVNYNQEKGTSVNLELCHALTAVQFSIGKIPDGYALTSVELQNIKTEGTYTFPTADHLSGEWNLSDKRGTLSLPDCWTSPDETNTIKVGVNPSSNKDEYGVYEDAHTFFVIPQKYENIKVCFVLAKGLKPDSEYGKIPIVISLNKGEFQAGTTKIFNISLSKSFNTFITEGPGKIYVNANVVNFNVYSYFQENLESDSKPVSWKYIGYIDDKGNKHEDGTTPDWIDHVTPKGIGGWNQGHIDIKQNFTTSFPWDAELAKAARKGDENRPYNLANKSGGKDIEETANCYVISAPGTYAIPLVYGNAIKDGKEKSDVAYKFHGNTHKDEKVKNAVLPAFVNAAGDTITSAYITDATGAEMLWQDRPKEGKNDIVSNLQIKNNGTYHYLQFEVSEGNIQSGNALVAVKHGEKTLWSWHLWFVPEKEYGGTAAYNGRNIAEYPLGYTPYEYGPKNTSPRKAKLIFRQNRTGVTSTFTVEQKLVTEHLFYMTYYQHGRKDPFSGDVVQAQKSKIKADTKSEPLAYGIQHPNTLINEYISNWCDSTYFNLWSANFSILDKHQKLNDNVKTIYDPCPVGYKVPPVNTFIGMDKKGGGKYDENRYGWTFDINIKKGISDTGKKLFIPMTGAVIYKSETKETASFLYVVDDGKFPYPEAEGFYQLATSCSESDKESPSTTRLYLEHKVGGYSPSDITNNLAEADAVLPVKDE